MKVKDTTIPMANNNDDEKSDIKKYIDEKFKEIKEIKEELDKLSKEIEKINQKVASQDSYDIAYTEIPPYCRNCKNHPINGGTGICHCIFGEYKYSMSITTDR